MPFTLKEIHDYRLRAIDGDFGEINTFIIDTDAWALRYLVVEVGSRQILLSVFALGAPQSGERVLPVNVSKEKILNSPTFEFFQTISREIERRFSDYFDWPYYWEPDDVPNTLPGDLTAVPLIDMELDREKQIEEQETIPETGSGSAANSPDTQLYSSKALFGGTIHTTNDNRNAGKLVDMVVQNEDWNILYLVCDTGGLLSGKKVLITPSWVQKINENGSRIDINLKQETIQNSPEFRTTEDLSTDYQDHLRDYFNH